MRTSNPVLTRVAGGQPDRGFGDLLRAEPATTSDHPGGPVLTGRDVVTVDGVVVSTLAMLALLVLGAVVGWNVVSDTDAAAGRLPVWTIVGVFASLGLVLGAVFRPRWARLLAPAYAVVTGVWVGSISKVYEVRFDGIVLQAVGLTVITFFLMLVLFLNRTIRATPRFRVAVISATGAIFVMYLASWLLRLFGAEVPFVHDAGPIGILLSLAIVVVAALNLILDFDAIERTVAAGAPAELRWLLSLGLVVTLVWLYIELLRLISKIRR